MTASRSRASSASDSSVRSRGLRRALVAATATSSIPSSGRPSRRGDLARLRARLLSAAVSGLAHKPVSCQLTFNILSLSLLNRSAAVQPDQRDSQGLLTIQASQSWRHHNATPTECGNTAFRRCRKTAIPGRGNPALSQRVIVGISSCNNALLSHCRILAFAHCCLPPLR